MGKIENRVIGCLSVCLICFGITSATAFVKSTCLDTTERKFTYQSPKGILVQSAPVRADSNGTTNSTVTSPESDVEDVELECVPPGIFSFPRDFFTQEQRQKGGVLVHFLILFYVCSVIAKVCDDYFIPSLEIISDKLNLPPDVAGATFMAIGASSPELFSSILGSFVTEGDIGVGAVIGSAVFNILGITGVVGFVLWNEVLDIDWYPMARDCIAYTVTVLCLVGIISDNKVMWWEALILLCIFLLYIVLMYFNKKVEKCARKTEAKLGSSSSCCTSSVEKGEKTPLLKDKFFVPEYYSSQDKWTSKQEIKAAAIGSTDSKRHDAKNKEEHFVRSGESSFEEDHTISLCSPPKDSAIGTAWWLFMLPASTLLFFTIPDTANRKCRILFPFTFLISVAWLGVLSYVAVWMVTIIGYTLSIPDSVSGLTILAVGASVPDLIATVLVAKSGEGNMAMSNLVGSNNFDISICLGVPWMAKALLTPQGYVKLHSSALIYATIILLVTLLAFYLVFRCSGWRLSRGVGFICLVLYAVFLVFACLFEFNVFGNINPPTCV